MVEGVQRREESKLGVRPRGASKMATGSVTLAQWGCWEDLVSRVQGKEEVRTVGGVCTVRDSALDWTSGAPATSRGSFVVLCPVKSLCLFRPCRFGFHFPLHVLAVDASSHSPCTPFPHAATHHCAINTFASPSSNLPRHAALQNVAHFRQDPGSDVTPLDSLHFRTPCGHIPHHVRSLTLQRLTHIKLHP